MTNDFSNVYPSGDAIANSTPSRPQQTARLVATLFAVPGKVPLYAEGTVGEVALVADGRAVGIEVGDGERRVWRGYQPDA